MATERLNTALRQQYQAFSESGVDANGSFAPYEAAVAYAVLSGACLEGCLNHVDTLVSGGVVGVNQRLSLGEIVKLTEGLQGADAFSSAVASGRDALAPYTSSWDKEINSPSEFSGINADSYRVLQSKSSGTFRDCHFGTLEYRIDTNTDTTLERCSGGYIDMDIRTCAAVDVRDSVFTVRSTFGVSTGRDVDIAVTSQYLDIDISTCNWFQFTMNNYLNGSTLPIMGITVKVSSANPDHCHALRLPLHGANGEDLHYYVTGDTPTITGDLADHIVPGWQAGAVEIKVTLGTGAPLELRAR
ncbi:MAG: hypothetical protein ABF780_06500 [Bifidobacterium aquikefiri]|uniref:Uncharacterized protein n=1 Tax=Bifidobacterium aquikefiri TaxID=1653207 RepID=A0A261G3H4_9BIFI|nr:hypothetical protein [Bifidobacterium aquikefiri]OZG65775.1 hypothetical protein BAQU_1513 [Bifidobacterium aquikefiri]